MPELNLRQNARNFGRLPSSSVCRGSRCLPHAPFSEVHLDLTASSVWKAAGRTECALTKSLEGKRSFTQVDLANALDFSSLEQSVSTNVPKSELITLRMSLTRSIGIGSMIRGLVQSSPVEPTRGDENYSNLSLDRYGDLEKKPVVAESFCTKNPCDRKVRSTGIMGLVETDTPSPRILPLRKFEYKGRGFVLTKNLALGSKLSG